MTQPSYARAVERAVARFAPLFPLDRWIAVNPLWPRIDERLSTVAADLMSLSGASLLMPRSFFREAWKEGRFGETHLRAALSEADAPIDYEFALRLLASDPEIPAPRQRFMDLVDRSLTTPAAATFRDFIVHATSQFCAAHYTEEEETPPGDRQELYAHWRAYALRDRAPSIVLGLRDYPKVAANLPQTAEEMTHVALDALRVPEAERVSYLTSLLLDVNGWASHCAYRSWQAKLGARNDADLTSLLAVRLAWEWMLASLHPHLAKDPWDTVMRGWNRVDHDAERARQHDWVFQRALEWAWQEHACSRISRSKKADRRQTKTPPLLQSVFCIDVRSEILRRALEAQDPRIETLGFAGFFGIPAAHHALGAKNSVPHLPGLLAPRMRITDEGVPASLEQTRSERLQGSSAWSNDKSNGNAGFVLVEAVGGFSGFALLREALSVHASTLGERFSPGSQESVGRPRLTARADATPLTLEERSDLARGILRGMSLVEGFAPLVFLIGHGSSSRNNPHAAGLHCGACGGNTGEASARAAADLLNDEAVRKSLAATGIVIPETTRFIAGLHDTTTDAVTFYDVPPDHAERTGSMNTARALFLQASDAARGERAAKLGLEREDAAARRSALALRARNWAEIRPEWGLANNAMLVVGGRGCTKYASFEGRTFLHTYRPELDDDGSILELIMTAPMIVTHWINFQYYASTVDNERYGSGNKVLHNVVGGHLGVFEGNGGDLRVGLPMQSLHDGSRWMHEPLRLSVFIEAPRTRIDGVLAKHINLRHLVENGWIHLFQVDALSGAIQALRRGEWIKILILDTPPSLQHAETHIQEQ